jgi:hypothetical protein
MAKDLEDLLEGANPEFSPGAFYSKEGDCLHVFISGDDAIAHRVDDVLTVYKTCTDERVTGILLKGIRKIAAEAGGKFGIGIVPGSKFTASAVVLCYLGLRPSAIESISSKYVAELLETAQNEPLAL